MQTSTHQPNTPAVKAMTAKQMKKVMKKFPMTESLCRGDARPCVPTYGTNATARE
jgi:hypothetical protein